jgi:hypothetical protein
MYSFFLHTKALKEIALFAPDAPLLESPASFAVLQSFSYPALASNLYHSRCT